MNDTPPSPPVIQSLEGIPATPLNAPAAESFQQEAARLLDDDIREWTHTAGPLPSAQELAAYEQIAPGMAESLMQLHTAIRIREEDRADRLAHSRERRRLIVLVLAFLLSLLCGANGIDALSAGHTELGLAFSGGSASALLLTLLKAGAD